MQRFTKLMQLATTASQVAEMARSAETFRFGVRGPLTFYLHTTQAEVSIGRWGQPQIQVSVRLQAPFGWRIETDQDEAGVYFVAQRRRVVGALAGARFAVLLPPPTHLMLKLDRCRLTLDDFDGTLDLPAAPLPASP